MEELARDPATRTRPGRCPRWRGGWVSLVLSGGVLLVFGRVIWFGFLTLDDGLYVYENPHVMAGVTSAGTRWALTAAHANYWLPLTWFSFMADAELFGGQPWGFHLTNLLLHTANCLLVLAFARRLPISLPVALFVTAVFAFHPSRLESVAWVTSRKDLLSTFFGLCALLAHIRWARHGNWWAYATVLLAFGASLLCKVNWVTLPLLLLLLDRWALGRWGRKNQTGNPNQASPGMLVLEKLPLLALALAASVWTARLHPLASAPEGMGSLAERSLQAGANYGTYLWRAMAAPDSALGTTAARSDPWHQILVWSLLLLVTVRAFWKPWPDVAFLGWLWFLCSLLPVSGLVSNGAHEIADRFLYFPIIGLALVLGSGLEQMVGRGRRAAKTAWLSAAALVAAMIALTSLRLPQWKDSLSLFPSILARSPENAVAWNALGRARESQGQATAALADYDRALAANPLYWQAAMNRANVLGVLGRHEEAITELKSAVRQHPGNARLKSNLGAGLFASGEQAEGIMLMRQALEIDPYLLDTRYNLALALKMSGDPTAARQVLDELLYLNPSDEAARALLETPGGR